MEPFTDMMVALKKKKLPGAALAARESLLWLIISMNVEESIKLS